MDLNKWWIRSGAPAGPRQPASRSAEAAPSPAPAPRLRDRAPARPRQSSARSHGLEQMVDLFRRRRRDPRKPRPRPGRPLGVAPVRRHARVTVPRDPMDLNKWWIRSAAAAGRRQPASPSAEAAPTPGPAPRRRARAPARPRQGSARSHGLEQTVDLFRRRRRHPRKPRPRQGRPLGGAPVRRGARVRVPRDPMDLNEWWICSGAGAAIRGSRALASASPSASRPCAGTSVSRFRVIPWT